MELIGQPLSGGSGGGGFIPTRVRAGKRFTVTEDSQALFAQMIVVEDTGLIVFEDGAVLIHVNLLPDPKPGPFAQEGFAQEGTVQD
ncbi:MAG: hypothetical protein QOG85_77 [Gaiellaceae bacterium]|nr:hypothetical protein [Gaiellaceae bacterium]